MDKEEALKLGCVRTKVPKKLKVNYNSYTTN